MKESTSPIIKMSGMTTTTLSCLLKYLYTYTLEVTSESALEVLCAANLLCLRGVEEACCEA